MPRKSSASLAVVPRVPGRGRPEPLADLDSIEQRIWREVVDALPGHWLDSAGQLVLRRLVAQAAVSERQEARLRQFGCVSCGPRIKTAERRPARLLLSLTVAVSGGWLKGRAGSRMA